MGSCFSVGLNTEHFPLDGNYQDESANLKSFSFEVLKRATRNFHPDCMLGEGRFGSVFKGWIDEQSLAAAKPGTGTAVAVKRLNHESIRSHQEWLLKINYFGQLNHQNLVKLIGYCLEGDRRLLVYEFMLRGSLENHLFRGGPRLSWNRRIRVALGAAKGLAYLHSDLEPKVINVYFKPSNILIDSSYNAKLSDFGMAKVVRGCGLVRDVGPNVYAAPEYITAGVFNTRSEIYSFGMVLLELLTGRRGFDLNRPSTEQTLVEFVKRFLKSKQKLLDIMDPSIQGQYSSTVATKATLLALKCLNLNPKRRPNAQELVNALEQIQELQIESFRKFYN
ncbi:hypothetical protein L1987_12298 [Smallanthus sonchifolius]|uniref:Uncharacterized protein n=1 Tax=Smallanthus sonchifolius TaxID=185202 RepID=A0ACB9JDU2_9ASTR|nr:hypothetical protein L1987_12298 [Smallanthus sonchifolius]